MGDEPVPFEEYTSAPASKGHGINLALASKSLFEQQTPFYRGLTILPPYSLNRDINLLQEAKFS